MAYRIDLAPCINCGWCRKVCPTECIRYFTTGRRTHVIDPAMCIDCGICARVCPEDCIHPDPDYRHDPAVLAQAREKAKAWARRRYARNEAIRARAAETARRLAAARA
ncbi:MAG TPA: 4Fe-4S binding protein [Dehalococcoidia bacterium]